MKPKSRPAQPRGEGVSAWLTLGDQTTAAALLSTSLNAFVLALHGRALMPTSGNECALRINFESTVFDVKGRVAWFNAQRGIAKVSISVDCIPEIVDFINVLHAVVSTAPRPGAARKAFPST